MRIDPHVLATGFKNIREAQGEISGFQLKILSPYYRGVYLSLLEGFELTVDGTFYAQEVVRGAFRAGTFTHTELAAAYDRRWQWFEPVTLLVAKPGGLEPGLRDVRITVKIRISYMPTRPTLFHLAATVPLVE